MKEGFRQSMAWLHTWTGLVVGWVLFFVFLTGTAGYIQIELTRWMQPERPLQGQAIPSVDDQFAKAYHWLQKNPDTQQAERWGIDFISDQRGRDQLNVNWSMPPAKGENYGKYQRENLNPVTGEKVEEQAKPRETGGGRALYDMHYALHYIPYDWAIRIVGICTMFMFVAIITGIITHKKIFKDFFTFRGAKGQRSWLDGHNVLSVIALPFHIMITYSGLIFFINAYMPLGVPLVYGFGDDNQKRYYAELYPQYYSTDADAKSLVMKDVAPNWQQVQVIYNQAKQEWGQTGIGSVNFYPAKGDSPAKVEFYKSDYDFIGRSRGKSLQFDLASGQQIGDKDSTAEKGALKFGNVLLGLHVGWFATPFLRWMYVITGLVGTAMIATGLVLWTVKRRPKQIKNGKMSFGHALVERLNIALIAGLPLGIAIYFWANRLLPVTMENRAAWEMHSLFLCILFALIYAIVRAIPKAWFELLLLTTLAYLLLPIVNSLTTDRGMWVTWQHQDWTLFSIDLGFILLGLLFVWISYAVWRKRNAILKAPVKKAREPRKPTTAVVEKTIADDGDKS
ncbi:PepSY-associated TM helix domain-containing protein [Acinetobacter puyangensis]|uniref:Uncharacterized iron-regulated membrane protein n=1 Tax=Acinetobacter puyangensis TaxID=1096779 RepID=A0A240EAK8_9GAMM|nr:PepSY-associated TM helix domain-containing protein [Acinetobacter puyangensis]SNX45586.1 Uncharacterized iron-regulated membrane protein [Acinetobacter puyangensis]